nr:PREDICTED: zinc finger MYM-type protein 1-like [Daucus carota subsp. sativus]
MNQSDQLKHNYRIQLATAIDCVKILLAQSLAFQGHDESETSKNRGNFIVVLKFLTNHSSDIKDVFKNAPENNKLTAPSIQKDITNACAVITANAISLELGDELFSILVDEARDISNKEQMDVVLRFVDKKGCVVERFVGIVHVTDTSAVSLKAAIVSLLATYGLSITRIRGQGYDGATKNHKKLGSIFNCIANSTNVVGGSCKRRDILRENRLAKVVEQLNSGELTTGRGLNQEISLKRAVDTRWGSHYDVIVNLISMYPFLFNLLEYVENHGTLSNQRSDANDLLDRKDRDLLNAMDLIKAAKFRFQNLREYGLEPLLEETYEFCNKNLITIPRMEEVFVPRGRSQRGAEQITNEVHYRTSLFYTVIDAQIVELNFRFNENKLIQFVEFYPADFSPPDLIVLENQLLNYIFDVKSHTDFIEVNGICGLAHKMVETKKSLVYPLVFNLVKLALTLPVATASAERDFSAMKIVKQPLRNRMGDHWLNDCLFTYIEKEIFVKISTKEIIKKFQEMKTRRVSLDNCIFFLLD